LIALDLLIITNSNFTINFATFILFLAILIADLIIILRLIHRTLN